MEKKNKIIAALAIGAVAILIGSGVARCSMDQAASPESSANAPIVGQAANAPSEGNRFNSMQEAVESPNGLEAYVNTQWTSEDKASSLALMEGILIERTGDESKVLYYTVNSEEGDSGAISCVVSVSDSLTGNERESLIRIEKDSQGGCILSCDELSSPYILEAQIDGDFALKGTTDELFEAFGKGTQDFETVISTLAKQKSPYATSATWDGQLWIDCIANTTVTNFVLDDPASTLISVTMDASGELMAS